MSKRPTGLAILAQGEAWRLLYLAGTPLSHIALTAQKSLQDVSRAVWLSKIPAELKSLIRAHPEVFTRSILINCFAAKRRQCEANGFAVLRAEVTRLLQEGAGTQPKLEKTNTKRRRPSSKSNTGEAFSHQKDYVLEVAYRIKEALGFPCKVAFSNKSAVSITFRDKAALKTLLIAIEPHSVLE